MPRSHGPLTGLHEIYLDANATVRPLSEVVETVVAEMSSGPANPSSAHWFGGRAREALERARDDVAGLFVGAFPEGVVFLSGGTEANNAVITGADRNGYSLVTTEVEHASVHVPARGTARRSVYLGVSAGGLLNPGEVADAVAGVAGPVCLSIQWANSETGVIQPMEAIVAEARRVMPDVLIHSDVAQAVGRVAIDFNSVPVDIVSFSGHKLHGPPGTGALVFRDPSDHRLQPFILGGGQEGGRRSGTQNVAGAAGLGTAARMRARGLDAAVAKMAGMRDAFEREVMSRVPGAVVNGCGSPRLPNTSSITFPGIDGMALLARLDALGIAASTGSACAAARPEPSYVLTAIGLSETNAYSTLRFSFSILNNQDEALLAARVIANATGELG